MTLRAESVILVHGDSLSAAYNMEAEQGWVGLLQQRLQEHGKNYRVHNSSRSGETTHGGLKRLPEQLATQRPDIVILQLGSNDGLRGQPPKLMRKRLETMVELAKNQGAKVLLLRNRLPPNYGEAYLKAFLGAYEQAAYEHELPMVSYFLEGVSTREDWMQEDRLHPNELAQPHILENVWTQLAPML